MKPFLCIPSWDGKISVETFRSLTGLIKLGTLDDAGLMVQGLDVVRMRNMAAYRFLRSDCSHLWFVDADVGFAPEVPLALMRSGLDFCAAIYPKKNIVWGVDRTEMLDWPFKPGELGKGAAYIGGAHFQRAAFLPMGCALIDRGVIETLSAVAEKYNQPLSDEGPEPHQIPNIFGLLMHPDPVGQSMLPEDYSFTVRARAAGYEAWALLDPVCTHTGSYTFNAKEIGT